jgi:hypothetical protein
MRILRNAGRRDPTGYGELHEIRRAVSLVASKEGASRSWVRNFIIGEFFGIAVPDFRVDTRKRMRVFGRNAHTRHTMPVDIRRRA